MAAISRSILPIDDLMKLKDSSNSCASSLSSSAQRGARPGGAGARGAAVCGADSLCDPLEDAGAQFLQFAGEAHDVDQRRAQVVADDVGEALDLLVGLLQVGGPLRRRRLRDWCSCRATAVRPRRAGAASAARAGADAKASASTAPEPAVVATADKICVLVGLRGADASAAAPPRAHGVGDIADARGGSPRRVFLDDLGALRACWPRACERHHRS